MRVLWISNIEITDESSGSGSWIFAMAHALLLKKGISLANIVPSKTKKVIQSDFKTVMQWKIPEIKNVFKTVLRKRDRQNVLDIISAFQPDLIHIWGLENGFALITPFVKCPVLLEIQGINSEIGRYCYADLDFTERLKLIRFREIITKDHIFHQKSAMLKMKSREDVICRINKYFTTPTQWMKANVEARTKSSKCFSTGFILRDEFYESKKWIPNDNKILLTSSSTAAPYKGLHVLLDSLKILKDKYPGIQLRIIGPYHRKGIRTNAYIYYLRKKIVLLGLEKNVRWLGSLNSKEICEQILQSSVFVNASFIESAGMTILEAMAVGIPIVSSYTGGIPSFVSGSVLFFTPGDSHMCAFQISKALTDRNLIISSGKLSRSYINKYHYKELVVTRQLDIYKTILKEHSLL